MSKVTIYHNPRCSKSRQTLALLRENDIEPEIVEYLTTPLDEPTLARLVELLGIEAAELVRAKEAGALGLPTAANEQELLRRITTHPQIMQRPIVVCGNRARIGRPPERVLEIL